MLEKVDYHRSVPDLFASPSWVDDGMEALDQLMQLRVQRLILEEQGRLLRKELRTTTQRVNLFEKVKIPECRDNIRTIRIFLGDQDTSAVARAKIAKGKATAKAAAQEV
jgi:V/A-type H+-transporting ATPase subunit D